MQWNFETKCFCTLCFTKQNVHIHFIFASKVNQGVHVEIYYIIYKNEMFIYLSNQKYKRNIYDCISNK